MQNPFELISDRLTNIEALLIEIRHQPPPKTLDQDLDLYVDFAWIMNVCIGVPETTLRGKFSSKKIPNTKKIGKRLLYPKAIVLKIIEDSGSSVAVTNDQLGQNADRQIDERLATQSQKQKRPKRG
ncbi:MAG: hypothetical protein EAZ91_24850 [Cytophagales bacterium]|nr:MAG: hypothetical protein EAZ91_24850 [Cytophagales bacterium]